MTARALVFLRGDSPMIQSTRIIAFSLAAALGLGGWAAVWAQESPGGRSARTRSVEADGAFGMPSDRPPQAEPGRGPKPPEGDFGGPPPKPPHEGDHGGRPAPPPRDGGYGPSDRDGNRPPPEPRWPQDDLNALEKNDPEMYKLLKQDVDLERQTRELAMQYRRAPKEQRDKIRTQIQELVNKHFDVRHQRRLLEVKRLEEDLQRLRETLARREKARKNLVDKRVSELLGTDDEVRF
jgi:hypothetical protein